MELYMRPHLVDIYDRKPTPPAMVAKCRQIVQP
jgi:hypothetical protein